MKPELRFDQSVLPPILLLILLIILGIVVIRSYSKEGFGRFARGSLRSLCSLRILAIATLMFILLKPVWFRLEENIEPGTVIVLVDVSESMEISDAPGRRLERAREVAADLVQQLSAKFQIRSYAFAAYPDTVSRSELETLDVQVTGVTNIGGAIQEAVQAESGSEIAGVILLSDGQHNSGPGPRQAAGILQQRGIPLFTVGIGAESRFKDLEIREFSGPRVMFRGEEARCSVRIVNYGFDQQKVPFRIRIEDHRPPGPGRPVDSRAGQLVVDENLPLPPPGTEERHTFSFAPEAEGVYRLSAELAVQADEEVSDNNRRELEIEVTRERLRVLLIESTPRWEYDFILRALRTDRRFAAAGLIELQDGVFRFQGVELNPEKPWANRLYRPPLSPDWSRLDAVIVGDVSPAQFSLDALETLRERIQNEGLVLVLVPGPRTARSSGFEATPLKPLLPFQGMSGSFVGPARVLPSLTGANHPAMDLGSGNESPMESWAKLHPLKGLYPVTEVAPASVVLAEAEVNGKVHPVIAFRRAGPGKVLQLAVEDTWRWRVDMRSGEVVGNVPATFWRQMIRWLITERIDDPGAGFRLLVEKPAFTRGERVDVEARVDVPPRLQEVSVRVAAEIIGADGLGKSITMTPGSRSVEEVRGSRSFRYSFVPLLYGSYQVRAVAYAGEETIGRDEVAFFVAESGLERARASLNRQLLRQIAEATGGKYFDADQYRDAPAAVPERNTIRVEPTTTRIWDSPFALLVFVGAVSLEWLIRKRRDMA